MILHIFPQSIFVKDYIEQINKLFSSDTHFFLIHGMNNEQCNLEYIYQENLLDVTKKYFNKKAVEKILDNADLIILHSLAIRMDLLCLLTKKNKYIHKMFPIFWGGDLYGWNDIKLSKKNYIQQIKFLFRNYQRNKILSAVKDVGFLIPQDYDFFNSFYKYKVNYFEINYSMEFLNQELFSFTNNFFNKKVSRENVNIMIGHSGDRNLNHERIMENLSKIHIKSNIHIPLAYGDRQYIEELEVKSKAFFGEYCHIYKDFLEIHEYIKLLSLMDIAIFDTNRQIAIGNISLEVLLGTVLCFRRGTPNYGFFHEYLGLDVIEIDDFYQLKKFNDLKDKINIFKNREIIIKYLGIERFISDWSAIFSIRR